MPDTVPKELETLWMNNPIVHNALVRYFRGEATLEQALILAVVALADSEAVFRDALIDKMKSCVCKPAKS